jgi:hypothetical protein
VLDPAYSSASTPKVCDAQVTHENQAVIMGHIGLTLCGHRSRTLCLSPSTAQ